MSKKAECLYEFGQFRLDVSERRLQRQQEIVPLSPKVFETLLVLIEQRGHVLRKEELIARLWPDSFVEESSLTQNISLIRKALGQGNGEQQFIQTVPKCGYRFVAPVRVLGASESKDVNPETIFEDRSETRVIVESEEEDETASNGLSLSGKAHMPPLSAPAKSDGAHHRRRNPVLLGSAVIALLAVLAPIYVWKTRPIGPKAAAATSAEVPIRSLAVLPFKPLGNESQDELLGLGMADAIIIKLSNFNQVSVRPTSSITRYAGREYDAGAIGQALGVDAVLDGTVQHTGERVRVSVMLLRLRDGKTLWSGKFDERFTDIFALQDSISERLAQVLQLQIAAGEQPRLNRRFTTDLEAYRYYMMGFYFWNKRTKEGLTKAIDYFQKATEKDPNYALAYAGLADCYCLTVYYNYNVEPSEKVYQWARAAALRALELDDTLAEAHAVMGLIKDSDEMDLAGAERSFLRAIELNPNSATAHLRYASALLARLRLGEALEHMKRAQELDPLSPTINTSLGAYYSYTAQYDEAIKYSKLALELEPEFVWARFNLGESYELKGMYKEALTEYQKLAAGKEFHLYGMIGLASVYARLGQKSAARQLLGEIERQMSHVKAFPETPFHIALIWSALGERDAAFVWLERSLAARAVSLYDLRYNKKLDSLKNDLRFEQVLSRHEYTRSLVSQPAQQQSP